MSVYYSRYQEDVISSSTPPPDPFVDQMWWDTTTDTLNIWDGTKWILNTPAIVSDPSKAPLASPVFTGVPTTPTAVPGTNTDQIASTAFVQTALEEGVGSPNWFEITGKPSTFPPSPHNHPQSEVTNLVSDLANKSPVGHAHAQSDVTNLVNDLAGKAPTVHTHTTADVTGLDTALTGKAPIVHNHAQADVTNLISDLSDKANLAGAVFTGKVTVPATVSNAAGLNIGVNAGAVSAPANGDLFIQFGSLLSYQIAAGSKFVATLDNTFNWTAKQVWMASATTGASMKITPGVAPTTPQQGDVWATTAGLFYRDASVTVGPLTGATDWSTITGKPSTFPYATPIPQTDVATLTTDLAAKANVAGQVFTGKIELPASTTATAFLNLPLGVTPTTPVPGDVWMTASGMVFAWGGGSYVVVHTNGNQTITGTKTFSSIVTGQAAVKAYSATAIPAGGTAGAGYLVSSTTNFGMFFGSGAPTLAAAKGSIYLRSDGASNTYTYVNTNGSTTWVPLLDTAGGGVTDGDKGDIVVSGSGATWMFDTSVVTAAAKTLLDDATTTDMRTTLGLGNVDNTTDALKPVSTATQTALDLKANLVGAAFTGRVTATASATLPALGIGETVGSPTTPVNGDIWITTTGNFLWRGNGTSHFAVTVGSTQTISGAKTFSAKTTLAASTATVPSINMTPGVAMTSAWANGDIWLTGTGIYARVNGLTQPLSVAVGTTAPSSPAVNDLWLDIN